MEINNNYLFVLTDSPNKVMYIFEYGSQMYKSASDILVTTYPSAYFDWQIPL